MDITKIWLSQRNLRRAGQIPAMVETLCEGGVLPPIILARCEDGEIQVEDGHHRLRAIWLSGRITLYSDEYYVVETKVGMMERARYKRSKMGCLPGDIAKRHKIAMLEKKCADTNLSMAHNF